MSKYIRSPFPWFGGKGNAKAKQKRTECLWSNPEAINRLKNKK